MPKGIIQTDKKRILIVDDEKDVLLMLEKRLTAEGYSVITATNGTNALQLAKSNCPDLIILDVAMPIMDGGEVAEKLSENPATKDIPIIFLTALFPKRHGEEQGCVVAGHVFIAKPYDIEELLAQTKNLLLKKGSTVS